MGEPATSAGAHGPGQERAPEAFRRYGLVDRLTGSGVEVVGHGDVVRLRMRPDPEHPDLRDADRVVAAATVVAAHVEEALSAGDGDRVLELGGDCTVQLGVVACAKSPHIGSVGLAYIDLDCDLTSPADGNGFADWQGVTHLLDAPDADPSMDVLRCSPQRLFVWSRPILGRRTRMGVSQSVRTVIATGPFGKTRGSRCR